MTKTLKSRAASFWVAVMTLGILGCLAGVAYTFYMIQQEAGQEGEYRMAADEMRLLSQQVAVNARESVQGRKDTFADLSANLEKFRWQMQSLQTDLFHKEVERIDSRWAEVSDSAQVLLDAGARLVLLNSVSAELEQNIKPIQSEFAGVVDILRDEAVSSETIVAAQKILWLTERIRTDAADFNRIVDALKNGSEVMGVDPMTDADAVESIGRAAGLFSVVSTSIEQIAGASEELRQAALAREAIAVSSVGLSDAISALVPAIDKLTLARLYDRGTLMALFGAPGVLAVGLLVAMYRSQRRRVEYTEQGVEEINSALVKIAEGDLTVQVPEENTVTREIAKEINASTGRQRELIRNIRTPFEISVEGITKIGVTAEGQVEKGRELTRSVVESTNATTEMVRTSQGLHHRGGAHFRAQPPAGGPGLRADQGHVQGLCQRARIGAGDLQVRQAPGGTDPVSDRCGGIHPGTQHQDLGGGDQHPYRGGEGRRARPSLPGYCRGHR
jgi:twitching motility protein PilJ